MISYRQFHKTLTRSSALENWISVRFYETDCTWKAWSVTSTRTSPWTIPGAQDTDIGMRWTIHSRSFGEPSNYFRNHKKYLIKLGLFCDFLYVLFDIKKKPIYNLQPYLGKCTETGRNSCYQRSQQRDQMFQYTFLNKVVKQKLNINLF